MFKNFLGSLIVLAVVSSPVLADEMTAAKRADIRALLQLTGDNTSFAKQFAALGARQVIMQLHNQPGFTPKLAQSIQDELTNVFSEGMGPAGALSAKIEDAYSKNYTAQEIKDLLTFFQSTTGKKFVSSGPALTKDIVLAGESWGKSVSPMINARLKDRLKREGFDPGAANANSNKAAPPAPATAPAQKK